MEINYWGVLGSAVASMVVGSIWYGPLFGKVFVKAAGMDTWSPERRAEETKKMGKLYFVQFVASLVMFYALAMFMANTNQATIWGGLVVSFWVWLGFIVPVKLGEAIWGGNMKLFWLGMGNMFFTVLAAGAIIGWLN